MFNYCYYHVDIINKKLNISKEPISLFFDITRNRSKNKDTERNQDHFKHCTGDQTAQVYKMVH